MIGTQSIAPSVSDMLAGQAEQAGRSASDDAELSRELSIKFESIFTSLLLKEMRQSIGEGGLFGGDSSDVFGGLFDMYLGEHVAKSSSLGIGEMVSKYIETQKSSNETEPAE